MRPFLEGERTLDDLRLAHRPTPVLQRYVERLERKFEEGRADLRDYAVYVAVKDLLRRRVALRSGRPASTSPCDAQTPTH